MRSHILYATRDGDLEAECESESGYMLISGKNSEK